MNRLSECFLEYWMPTVAVSIVICAVMFAINHPVPDYKILTIDGCEYIQPTSGEKNLVHKANCKNH